MGLAEWTAFPTQDGQIDVSGANGEVAICVVEIVDDADDGRALLSVPAATAINIAIRILELAGCSVRRVAFGHMLPDQVTVGVPPEVVDGEVEELPEAGT